MKKPNIVLIMNDHQAFYRHGWDGGVKPKRPNFDNLAKLGVEFTNAYCGTPLCGPVRRSIINGLYAHNHKHYYNDSSISYDNEESYLKILKENGYNNYYYGKWHAGEGTPITDHDCEGFSCEAYGNPYITKEYSDYLEKKNLPKAKHIIEYDFNNDGLINQGDFIGVGVGVEYSCTSVWCGEHCAGITTTPKETHESFFLANLACDKLDELAKSKDDKPFHLRVDFWGPHQPFFPTQEFADMYNPEDITEYGNFSDNLENRADVHKIDTNKYLSENDKLIIPSPLPWKDWQIILARAYAHQTMIDAAGGQILDKLKELGLDDNTIIIWSTDHGDGLASHGGHFDKCSYMSQEVMRIPMTISYPNRFPANSKNNELISNIDIPSTILDAAKLKFKNKVDSRSLFNAIENAENWSKDIMCETYGHGYAERITGRMYVKGDYKYVTFENQIKEMYNLKIDPYEFENLAYNDSYKEILIDLENGLKKLQKESNDPYVIQ